MVFESIFDSEKLRFLYIKVLGCVFTVIFSFMGLIINEVLDGEDHLGVWHICESLRDMEVDFFGDDRSTSDYQKYATIKLDKLKKQWLATRLALRVIKKMDPTIDYDEHGAPWLKIDGWEISISHSGDWVAVLLSHRSMLGVDIQVFNEKIRNIAAKFSNPSEYAKWHKNNNMDYLHALWTVKESVYKAFKHSQAFKQIVVKNDFPFTGDFLRCEVERGNKTYDFLVNHRRLDGFYLSYVRL